MTLHTLSRKIPLTVNAPTETDNRSAQLRILDALRAQGFDAAMSVAVMRSLHSLTCDLGSDMTAAAATDAAWHLTASLAWNGYGWEVVKLEKGDTHLAHYGIAADLGSTTLVMQLYNCETGEMIAQESAYSRQIAFGEDILTRIFYAKDNAGHLEEIRRATVDTFEDVMQALTAKTGIDCHDCIEMTVAGNTTMIHFLIGMDAFCVFQTPYAVQADQPGFMRASDLGLNILGYIYCFPAKANYLGGDIISGMVAVDFIHRNDISLFFDVGTNGELVIGNKDFLLCGAGAAGPALEGGVVRTGMRAAEGAIEAIRLVDSEPIPGDADATASHTFIADVIGGGPAKGICGSGIVDLISGLFIHGWLSIQGKLQKDKSPLIELRNLPVESDEDGAYSEPESEDCELCVRYAPGLFFWQSDIDEFIRTKAAAATMMGYMMDQSGLKVGEVDRFYMAGAFGTHVNKESAVNIGMYPDVDRERIIAASNTSLAGAAKLLLNMDVLDDLDQILGLMTYVQFGAVDDFLIRMQAAQALPHTDIEVYPSVLHRLHENGVL